jgi:hypothetical protein
VIVSDDDVDDDVDVDDDDDDEYHSVFYMIYIPTLIRFNRMIKYHIT